MPEDFHKHWYWDRYSEPSELVLDPLRVITHTTSTKRLPSAFEATEPRERLCGRCRLPGHTRNSLRCMHNIRQLNQQFQDDQLAMRPDLPNSRELHTNSEAQSIAQVALQEFESLSPEPENPATEVDTRPIWPGRIELIYQAYLAEKTTWLAANPTVRPAQYRTKRGLRKLTKAIYDSQKWKLPRQRIDLESKTLIEGPPGWLTEEIQAWLDWDPTQEEALEQQLEVEYIAAGGFGSEGRRGIGHIHRRIEAEVATERSQYRFYP